MTSPEEGFEYPTKISVRNSESGIFNPENHKLLFSEKTDVHPSAWGRVSQGIVEQISSKDREGDRFDPNRNRLNARETKIDRLVSRCGKKIGDHLLKDVTKLGLRVVCGSVVAVPRQREQLLQQVPHPPDTGLEGVETIAPVLRKIGLPQILWPGRPGP